MLDSKRRVVLIGSLAITGLLLVYNGGPTQLPGSVPVLNVTVEKCNLSTLIPSEDWKAIRAKDMSAEQIFKYLKWSNSTSCQLVYDFGGHVFGDSKKRGIDGQKAVCMDPNVAPVPGTCLIYSFGISNEWSFDKHFGDFGCHVCAFDPSMRMSSGDFTDAIHFYNFGLSDRNEWRSKWELLTLTTIYRKLKARHGPRAIDYLKIDIEGDEWNSLQQILHSGMLNKVKQLGVEFHFPVNGTLDDFRYLTQIIQSLEDYGMIRFASRVNMWMRAYTDILNRTDNQGFEIAWYNEKFINKPSVDNNNVLI